MTHMRIGVIGLGAMGLPMTRRLIEHGYATVSCANRTRIAIDELKKLGLTETPSPREVAAQSDILLTLVVDEKQTDTVLLGSDGALAGAKPGAVVLIMSTVSPSYCQKLAATARQRGIAVLDCPISGGMQAAGAGTLTLMVGGDANALERCRAPLEVLGRIYHCGDVGSGQVAKLANNVIAFTTAGIILEARAMARAYGTDMRQLMEILGRSTGKSFVVDHWDHSVANWEHLVPLGKKDVGLCLDAAKAQGVSMPTVAARYAMDWALPEDEGR